MLFDGADYLLFIYIDKSIEIPKYWFRAIIISIYK